MLGCCLQVDHILEDLYLFQHHQAVTQARVLNRTSLRFQTQNRHHKMGFT